MGGREGRQSELALSNPVREASRPPGAIRWRTRICKPDWEIPPQAADRFGNEPLVKERILRDAEGPDRHLKRPVGAASPSVLVYHHPGTLWSLRPSASRLLVVQLYHGRERQEPRFSLCARVYLVDNPNNAGPRLQQADSSATRSTARLADVIRNYLPFSAPEHLVQG